MNAIVQVADQNQAKPKAPKENHLTKLAFEKAVPKSSRHLITDKLINDINDLLDNTALQANFRDNLLSFTNVLQNGRFKLGDYVNAVKYCSFKLMGDSNIMAYTKAFPDRYQRMVDDGWASKDINSLISGYHKSLLVTKILEQAIVPTWLVNQDLYQKAINAQAELMLTAKSEKVRSDAANSLLIHLKMPEVAKVQLDVTTKEDDSINELRKATMELVRMQRMQIAAGAMNAKEAAEARVINEKVIEGEVIENG